MPMTIYHNPNCSTSRKVLGWLREKGHDPKVIEYLKTPPDAATMKKILKTMDAKAADIVRRKGDAYEALNEASGDIAKLSDDALIQHMLADPVLIERPIVVSDKGAVLCRPAERVWEVVD